MIFTVDNLKCKCWFGVICNSYLWKNCIFNNCKVDCVMSLIALHLNLRFLKVHFRCANTISSCSCHLQFPKTLICNFLKHCREGQYTKNRTNISLIMILQFLCNFTLKTSKHTNKKALWASIWLDFGK